MTRDIVIEILKDLRDGSAIECWLGETITEALDMAIEALQTPPISQRSMYQLGYIQGQEDALEDRPKGEWIEQENEYYHYWECSECGIGVGLDDIRNFCPNCGSDNRERSEE